MIKHVIKIYIIFSQIFLNKTNAQTLARKLRNAYIVGRRREYSYLLKFCNVLAIRRINVSDNKLLICYRFLRAVSMEETDTISIA
jgi:hypothetical protein